MVSWNLRGKSLDDVARIWDLLSFAGTHVIGLQELGGLPERCPSHDVALHTEVSLAGRSYTFFYADSSHAFRGSAIGIPTSWLGKVEKTCTFCTGIGLVLKDQGIRQFFASIHLPYKLREDCLQVWQQQVEELISFCSSKRYHDEIAFCCDLNYDILDIVNVDERGVPLGQLLRTLGLEFTRFQQPTWSNTSGACSRIDFILFSLPSMTFWDDRVLSGSDAVIGSDHCAVSVSLQSLPSTGRSVFQNSKCGKWWTQGPQLMNKASALAEHLELSMADVRMEDLSSLCQSCSRRITSCRFVDTPDIKNLIARRKRQHGREARELAKQIADTRRRAKKEWLATLLQKSAEGDYRAIAYFKKRNTAMYTQGSYCIRAGGRSKAIADLRFFYQRKYTPPDPTIRGLPRAIFHERAGPILNPAPFTLEEVRDVAFMCKHNKSTGADGISYEALQMLLQSELAEHILDMYNGVLRGLLPIPRGWLHSHVCFLPKTSTPCSPADLRPIVLSSTVAKVFTKALMLRLRPKLPSIGAFQVGGVPQRQILDAACAVQQAIRLSEQYGNPLVIVKLDVAAAFDSLSHASIASFLAQAQGSREAEVLLDVICNSCVGLGLQGTSWDQPLRQGVLQGSSYSAELFARCVDFYMSFARQEWQQREETWLQTPEGRKLFLTPFADDLVLIATSRDQAVRLLEDTVRTLGAIGLRMNWRKCKYIQTPGLPKNPLKPCGTDIQWAQSFVFLGILIGFQLSCQAVLAARMTKVSNAFWAYYRILRQHTVGLSKRLQIFDIFITSRWRWLSPAVKPSKGIRQFLRTTQATFLFSILGFSRDPFQGSLDSWIARRRASRLAAQLAGHKAWEGQHAIGFFGYWGHAARYHPESYIPIAVTLRVRGPEWLFANGPYIKRLPGRTQSLCADASRFLQRAWEQYLITLGQSPPTSWISGALDRDKWRHFSTDWCCKNDSLATRFYSQSPEDVDLKGCQLVQNGDLFSLLHTRHPPVEEPYSTSFVCLSTPSCEIHAEGDSENVLRVFSDGSAPNNRRGQAGTGGGAVVILGPYALVERATVCYFQIPKPCTNIQAELHAAAQALRMIRQVRHMHAHIPITFHTDSQYVLQILEGSFQGTHHASVTNEIISLWSELCLSVECRHVRAHKGILLNEIADAFAKTATQLRHYRKTFCTLDRTQAALTYQPDSPVFIPWL